MAINRAKQKTLRDFPTAVATKLGWVDPVRGELLVSIRGLPKAVDWDRKTNTFTKDGKAFDPTKKEKAAKAIVVEVPEEKVPEVIEKIKADAAKTLETFVEKEKAAKPKKEKAPKETKPKADPKPKAEKKPKATKKKVEDQPKAE